MYAHSDSSSAHFGDAPLTYCGKLICNSAGVMLFYSKVHSSIAKCKSKRAQKYKSKVKQQRKISHSKSRLRSALAKAATDFQREKEEQKEQIKFLSK